MFWGRGDTSQLNEDEARTLSHLRRMAETGHIVALNNDQVQMAIDALDWYSQWNSTLRLLKSLRNTALLFVGLLGLWWAGQEWIVEFIKKAAE